MAKFNFYPLEIDHRIEGDTPYILLFGRTDTGSRICVKSEFYPYIWIVPKESSSFNDTLQVIKTINEVNIKEIIVDEKLVKGAPSQAIKVTLQTPDLVPQLRKILEDKHISFYEADILFTRRFIIDKDIIMFQEYIVEGEETSPLTHCKCILASSITQGEKTYADYSKILSIDIEVYPHDTNRDQPVLMIAFSSLNFKKVLTWKRIPEKDILAGGMGGTIEVVDGEAELITRFKEVIREFEPDIITGYFTDGYDFPYLYTRAEKYKIKLDLGLDGSQLKFGKGARQDVRINGILHLDAFNFTKNLLHDSLKSLESLKLDEVGKALLGIGKHDVNILQLGKAWDNNDIEKLVEFCKYNLQDTEIARELCIQTMPSLVEMVKVVGLSPFDVSRMSLSQMVEWFLIKNAPKHNSISPNKPEHEDMKVREMNILQGAFVYEPNPGLYKDVLLFDFRSLYPTIIASHNLSGETFRCKCCADASTKVPLEGRDYWFCSRRKGFLPEMIADLIERRQRVKEIMKESKSPFLEARQISLKLLANSFYGYLAFNPSRWYSFEAANSTTAFARHYIKNVIDTMTKEGFKVIYGDTDSVFITVENQSQIELVTNVAKEINKTLPPRKNKEY